MSKAKIKKVAVSPLPRNQATVIDSLNTSDDKTTNAPSIHAVNEALDNIYNKTQGDARYKLQGDFAIATTTITMTDGEGNNNFSYPTGFTKTNCVVLSMMCNNTVNTSIAYGYIENAGGYIAGAVGHRVTFNDNNISVHINNPQGEHNTGTGTFECTVVLMKVS